PGVVIRAAAEHLADLAVMDALDRLHERRLVPVLRAGDNRQLLFLGLLAELEDLADADRVDGAGLLDEAVLALLDRVREVDRAESGGRREEDEVHAAVDDLLIGVPTGEHVVRADFVAVELAQGPLRALDAVGEHVAERGELDVGGGGEAVLGGAGAAAAAADEADL